MHKTLRRLPSLDFLRGFEAAGRRLSFTLAAEELFVTQSALSRQVKALEDALGVALFERRHRALALTPAGRAFHQAVTGQLQALAAAAEALGAPEREPGLTVSTTVSFASLWLIPRLPAFRALYPRVDVYVSADDRVVDLARGDVDVAIRYLSDTAAPRSARKLFGERLLPVASPRLVKRGPALRTPQDLAGHVLLNLDDPAGAMPWLNWPAWLNSNGASRAEARGRDPLLALRPAHPGDDRRTGRGARPHSSDRGPARAGQARGALRQALRFPARLLRAGRAARRHAAGSGGIPRLAARGGAGPAPGRRHGAGHPRLTQARRATYRKIRMNAHDDLAPSPWIARFAHLVPPGARVLDLAAGRGRHARLFAARGAHVVAVDRDAVALASLAGRGGHRDPRARPRRTTRGRSPASASPPSWSSTTCTGRSSRTCAPRSAPTACCSTRRSRWATRRSAARRIPITCCARGSY